MVEKNRPAGLLHIYAQGAWQGPMATMTEESEPKEIFEDFEPELFKAPPKREFGVMPDLGPEPNELGAGLCPFYPMPCHKVGTSGCNKECEHNPESYMDPKIKDVFDKEPWSNYCYTCGEFIPSRNHEAALEPPEQPYTHVVATGYNEYRVKLSKWVLERMTGHHEEMGGYEVKFSISKKGKAGSPT